MTDDPRAIAARLSKAHAWALEWRSKNRLDGERRHLIYEDCLPKLFRTRTAARAYACEKFGYIADRPDLQGEPHGWRVPRAVRAIVAAEDGA